MIHLSRSWFVPAWSFGRGFLPATRISSVNGICTQLQGEQRMIGLPVFPHFLVLASSMNREPNQDSSMSPCPECARGGGRIYRVCLNVWGCETSVPIFAVRMSEEFICTCVLLVPVHASLAEGFLRLQHCEGLQCIYGGTISLYSLIRSSYTAKEKWNFDFSHCLGYYFHLELTWRLQLQQHN